MTGSIRFASIAAILFVAGAFAEATDFIPARAVVTTVDGECTFQPEEGRASRPALHAVLEPTVGQLETGIGSQLGLSISNGLGLALYGRTRLEVKRSSQTPFDSSRVSLDTEPSVSGVDLVLHDGAIALAHPEPSPLSQIRVATATGTFLFNRGRATIAVDQAGSRVFIEEGSGSFIFPDGAGRELMAAGTSILVTPYSASRGTATKRGDSVPAVAGWLELGSAASNARQRVLHLAAADEGKKPFLLLKRATDPAAGEEAGEPNEEDRL